MGLFSSKEEKEKIKLQREIKKKANNEILERFKENSSLILDKLYFDDNNMQLLIKGERKQDHTVIEYSQIISYSEIIDGKNVKKKKGVTRAIVGGALAGSTGAIVGASTGGKQFDIVSRMAIVLNLSDNSFYNIELLNNEWKKDSFVYKTTYETFLKILAKLDRIIKENGHPQSNSSADEIRKFKQLLDDGIITEEEFNKKKTDLLNME